RPIGRLGRRHRSPAGADSPPTDPQQVVRLEALAGGARQTMIKVGMASLGCPKNLVDTEVMLGTLEGRGYALTRDPADADVIVVNTCTFIGPARQESVDTILEMAEHKKTGRCRRLVVAGCMVQSSHDELRESI